ncbi:MAG: ACP phosphodiesterase [Bacteroidota bacterium]
MNFLAHLYLSGDDPDIRIGNFIGDFVKGRNPEGQFPARVALGIQAHRLIDQFTDAHPLVRSSKDRIRAKYRHYSGVIVDIYYDHFLARQWADHHPVPLNEYAQAVYRQVREQEKIVPERAMNMLPWMEKGDWLTNYSHVEGIRRVLTGMSRRTPYACGMEHAAEDLIEHYEGLEDEFNRFLPEVKEACREFISFAP